MAPIGNIFNATPAQAAPPLDFSSGRAALGTSTQARLNVFSANGNSWSPQQTAPAPQADPTSAEAIGEATFKGLPQAALDTGKNFLKGLFKFGKSAATAPETIATGGKKVAPGTYEADASKVAGDVVTGKAPLTAALGPIADTVEEGGSIATLADPEIIDATKSLAGKAAGAITDTAKATAGVASDAVSELSDLAKKSGTAIKNTAVGKDTIAVLKKLDNPDATAFIPKEFGGAGKTLGDVASGVDNAVNSFVSKSKAALKAVKDSLPDVQLDRQVIAEKVNKGITDAIGGAAKYKGVAMNDINSAEDLITKGVIKPDEVPNVQKMVSVVKNWSDYSARGILNLKESLGDLYESGSNGSNAVLSKIQSGLKDAVGEVAPSLKGALKTASDNIDTAEQFQKNLIGRDTITGESKLKSIANALKDPTLNKEKLDLLDQLKSVTGFDAQKEVKGFADFESLLKKYGSDASQIPSKTKAVLKALITRGSVVAGGGIGLKGAYDLIKGK